MKALTSMPWDLLMDGSHYTPASLPSLGAAIVHTWQTRQCNEDDSDDGDHHQQQAAEAATTATKQHHQHQQRQ